MQNVCEKCLNRGQLLIFALYLVGEEGKLGWVHENCAFKSFNSSEWDDYGTNN